jgi:G3E family GTPase
MNPTAKRLYAENCQINLQDILNIQTFNVDHKLNVNPNFLDDHHHHHHDDRVSSVAFKEERPLDMSKVDRWMSYLVQEKGEDLLRYKGILNIAGVQEKIVFQGLHMLFTGKPDKKWQEGETRKTELVFIGRNLDKVELKKQFDACIVS